VTNAVHAHGSFIKCQLWALGRAASPDVFRGEGRGHVVVSASDIPLSYQQYNVPRALTKEEIKEYVHDYAQAAKNAIRAGFDGVEIHAANGA
jgi:NADPH2 dehydrogenase